MLHNKEYLIISKYLSDYKQEIYGRSLTEKVKMSQKAIALAFEELEKQNVLKSRKQGNIKYYSLNLENTEIKDIIAINEKIRKIEFLSKNRKLANLFKKDERVVGIFGSYARGEEKTTSDIDVFIIGTKQKKDYDELGKEFDFNISIKYFTEKEFKTRINEKNRLCDEIIKNHVLIFGSEKFIQLIWEEYYDLN